MADNRSLTPRGNEGLQRAAYDPFVGFRQELDQLFQDFGRSWPRMTGAKADGYLIPKVDIAETEEGLELTAELPGFDEKDVTLNIQDGVLTVKAEHSEEHEQTDRAKQYHLSECSRGSFLRRFALPFEPDADKAEASMERGLLKVTVPRLVTPEKRPRQIPIGKSAEGTKH